MSSSRPIWLWLLLAAPAAALLAAALRADADIEALLHPSGELSARLLIVALALTPLTQLFPGVGWLGWLRARRRAIGVAAFGYAALHTLLYFRAMSSLADVLAEVRAPGIWTGWAALLLLLAVAAVSNDAGMRALGRGWKAVQRLAWPAALLTLAHWLLVHNSVTAALLNFAPLVVLQLARLLRHPRFVTTPSLPPTGV